MDVSGAAESGYADGRNSLLILSRTMQSRRYGPKNHSEEAGGIFCLAFESQFLAVLDDERGFIVNSVFFANLLKVFVLL